MSEVLPGLIVLFASVSLATYVVVMSGVSTWSRLSRMCTELTEHRLEGLFLFTDSRKLIFTYLFTAISLLVVVYWFSFSIPFLLILLLGVLYLPKVVYRILQKRRARAVSEALPDVLAQMAGSMKAGSTFVAAMQTMVDETDGPISQEFSLLLRELRLGTRLEEALDDLAERVQSEEMDLVVSAAMIARDVGGNLSEIFTRLSMTLRRKLEMEKKISALTAQGVLQGWVVGLLPFAILLAMHFMEPNALIPLWNSILGWVFLCLIVILESIGGLMIRKIVSIDI